MNNTPPALMPFRNVQIPLLTSSQYDAVSFALIAKFGDEGHDIGDASSIIDLIANTCSTDDEHDSYTVAEMIAAIYAALPRIPLYTAQSFCSTVFLIVSLDAAAYNELFTAYDNALNVIDPLPKQ